MPININGTTGISGVDGSAGTPSIQGSDTNTGVFFPAADTAAIATGGAERVRVDSSGNVGIGTSSPTVKLQINQATTGMYFRANASTADRPLTLTTTTTTNNGDTHTLNIDSSTGIFAVATNGSERARIDSSGNLLVGKTSADITSVGWHLNPSASGASSQVFTISSGTNEAFIYNNTSTGGAARVDFRTANVSKGNIQWNNTNTAYNTTSDYRLKEDVQPMTGALAKVAALKPCTYTWKADGSNGEGFIAHELQEIVPQCVSGAKDAVDADGTPVYQGIDTSFLVATLTAAIQELNAKVEAQAAEIAILKGAA